jgi:anaerobic ribonucleoside-triphosphate reductase
MINKAYMTVMMKGDIKGRPFTFPIPTYNMTPDFPWEDDNTELLFEMTAKYGLPYFQNFINSVLKPGQIRSMCCRLQLDLRELLARGNGLFGSAEQTGSIGVITFNCARLGYVYKGDEAGLFARVDELMNIARTSLEIKRKVIQRLIDNGLFPFTKRYLGTLRNHFSTIGVNGINEMIRNFTNDEHNIADQWGQDFAVKFLDYIRAKMVKIQEETGHMYNLEATPAESATYRFAREDKKRFKGIIQAGTEENPYYTNSSQLPVGFTDDPFEALDLQSTLQTKYTGGTVLHLYMGQRISSAKVCRDIVRKVLTNYRLPYVTITPTFSVCPKHGYISGEHKFCPICDEEKKAEKRAAASRTEVA